MRKVTVIGLGLLLAALVALGISLRTPAIAPLPVDSRVIALGPSDDDQRFLEVAWREDLLEARAEAERLGYPLKVGFTLAEAQDRLAYRLPPLAATGDAESRTTDLQLAVVSKDQKPGVEPRSRAWAGSQEFRKPERWDSNPSSFLAF